MGVRVREPPSSTPPGVKWCFWDGLCVARWMMTVTARRLRPTGSAVSRAVSPDGLCPLRPAPRRASPDPPPPLTCSPHGGGGGFRTAHRSHDGPFCLGLSESARHAGDTACDCASSPLRGPPTLWRRRPGADPRSSLLLGPRHRARRTVGGQQPPVRRLVFRSHGGSRMKLLRDWRLRASPVRAPWNWGPGALAPQRCIPLAGPGRV